MSTSLNTLEVTGMTLRAMINELDENFPPHTPSPSDPYEYIMYRAGQRSVVEWILNKMDE